MQQMQLIGSVVCISCDTDDYIIIVIVILVLFSPASLSSQLPSL